MPPVQARPAALGAERRCGECHSWSELDAGLGLSLVHGIVADFAGGIDVMTQAGVGTTFTAWLPTAGETPQVSSATRKGTPL